MNEIALTLREVRMLARCEREMDRGDHPFVIAPGGHRAAVTPEVLAHLGLESGQSASAQLMCEILNAQIAQCTRESDEAAARVEDSP